MLTVLTDMRKYNVLQLLTYNRYNFRCTLLQGNKFQFYGGQCTAVKSTVGADSTETELSCNGEDGQGFNRLVKLRLSPGVMQMEEKGINLRYYRCAAPA